MTKNQESPIISACSQLLEHIKFSLFFDVKKGIFTTTPTQTIDFKRLIEVYNSDFVKTATSKLKQASDKDKPELKKQLPFITPYGTFNPSRKKDYINHFNSKLIALDIDSLTVDESKEVKDILSLNESTLICAISPRGKGVKALILINDVIPLEECYNTLKLNKSLIAETLNIFKFLDNIDNSQFNITQPLFIAFDEALFYNEHAKPLNIKLAKYVAPTIERRTITKTPIQAKNRIEAYLLNATNKLIEFFALCSEGNRHANIIKVQSISSWLHYAPQIESEVKQSLYHACCSMYGNEKQALSNGVKRAFDKAWETPQKANNVIESIINELNNVA